MRGESCLSTGGDLSACNAAKQCIKYTTPLSYLGGSTRSVITGADCTALPGDVTAACLVSGAGQGTVGVPCSTFTTERYNFKCSDKTYTCWMIYCTGCSKTSG